MIGKPLSQRIRDREKLRGRRFSNLEALADALLGIPPDAYHVVVIHEDGRGCSRLQCKCSPTYVMRELTTETYVEGEELETEWLKANAS